MKDPSAKRYDKISYLDVLKYNLKVMDSTAISMCMDNNLPIVVFDIRKADNIKNLINGKRIGTLVSGEPKERR